jgi:3-hydroxyacyl-CoA dehydrogenase
MTISTVTVLGANGAMGKNVSAIFASFGNAKVYMMARTLEQAEEAADQACYAVKAGAIKKNCIPVDYSVLEECVKKSDLVFESVKEDLEIKASVTRRVADCAGKETIFASGTSGLSLTALAECFPEELRKNYMGIHMFNPPYNMPLCELIATKYTDRGLYEAVWKYIKEVLRRTPVKVKDSPAFLGNRIGFQFINEAMQYADLLQDSGGIDYIDAILGPFTGRNLPPLATTDFVGLDVHKAIVDNLYENTDDYARETFRLPGYVQKRIEAGELGSKTGAGLYQTKIDVEGRKKRFVFDIQAENYREKMRYVFPFAEHMVSLLREGRYQEAFDGLVKNHSLEARLCTEFLLKYILYSLNTVYLVGENVHAADDVMAAGFNWCPPLAMIDAFSGKDRLEGLVKERLLPSRLKDMDIERLMNYVEPSEYDYRRFLRAKY